MSSDKNPAWEAEYDTVRDLLSQTFMRLRFPLRLERDFRARMHQRAVNTLREYYWLLYLFSMGTVAAIYLQYTVRGQWIGAMEDLYLLLAMGGGCALLMIALTVCTSCGNAVAVSLALLWSGSTSSPMFQ